ncbi:N-acetyllactosaminide beta-1,3-N-acetylglucosaminyltransferase 2-like [Patiria miniata]|uniref:Hexosyltransferase n=1 Tax=Patiria miniata TaxID=46514 RepID=A0A913Z852_PATMI|nr:N-acetyllactosaminide beta-1,3-N-acetylglucosaminyltransferase 2-like [Patiria miniata]
MLCTTMLSGRNTKRLLRSVIVIYFIIWFFLTVSKNDSDTAVFVADKAFTVGPEFQDERSVIHHQPKHDGKMDYIANRDRLSFVTSNNISNFSRANSTLRKDRPLYSDNIINPHPFHFTLFNHNACTNAMHEWALPLQLLILVKSRPEDIYDRQQIRETWGGAQNISNQLTLTMFLLGQTPNATVIDEVSRESLRFEDIIQENFIDAYTNLTYKTMMGLRWGATFCPFASFVASVDSDIILNLHNLLQRLADKPRHGFAEGSLKTNWTPYRDAKGQHKKWYTPVELYPEPTYPPFFPGGCYVMSADVAATIYRESVHVRFLPWDDVFVGLVMQRAGITPRDGKGYQVYIPLSRYRTLMIRLALQKGIAVITKHNSKAVDQQLILMYQKAMQKYKDERDAFNIPDVRHLFGRIGLYNPQGLKPRKYGEMILRYQLQLGQGQLGDLQLGRLWQQPQAHVQHVHVQPTLRGAVPDGRARKGGQPPYRDVSAKVHRNNSHLGFRVVEGIARKVYN